MEGNRSLTRFVKISTECFWDFPPCLMKSYCGHYIIKIVLEFIWTYKNRPKESKGEKKTENNYYIHYTAETKV